MTDPIPDRLMFKHMKNDVIKFISRQQIHPRHKKELYIAWCKAVGHELTHAAIRRLLGPLEDFVR